MKRTCRAIVVVLVTIVMGSFQMRASGQEPKTPNHVHYKEPAQQSVSPTSASIAPSSANVYHPEEVRRRSVCVVLRCSTFVR